MSESMQEVAFELAVRAMDRYNSWGDMAEYIKDEFDRRYDPAWQCIVGNFGCYVTHKANCYLTFSIGETQFLLFRSHYA
jgi:dynein light chain LC8-type